MKKMMLCAVMLAGLTLGWVANGAALDQKMIAADAKWLIHADLDGLRAAKFGAALFKVIDEGPLGKVERQITEKLGITLDFGKVKAITAYGTEFEGDDNNNGIVLIQSGQDIKPALEALIKDPKEEVKITRTEKDGLDLFALNGEMFLSQLPGNLLVASRTAENVVKANSVVSGKEPNLSTKNAFANYPKVSQPVLLLQAEGFNKEEQIPATAEFLKQSEGLQLTLGEAEEQIRLDVALKTPNQEASDQVSQVINGLMALVRLNQENPDLTRLLERVKVSAAAQLVSINVTYPVEEALKKLAESQ